MVKLLTTDIHEGITQADNNAQFFSRVSTTGFDQDPNMEETSEGVNNRGQPDHSDKRTFLFGTAIGHHHSPDEEAQYLEELKAFCLEHFGPDDCW